MENITSTLHIAKSLIQINTTQTSGIDEAMKWLREWATQNGLHQTTFQKTKALLIQTNPQAKKHLNFTTHVDVVPADGWKSAFTPTIKDDYLVGRGSVDDKGPLAIALTVLLQNKDNSDLNISCLVVTDEETSNSEIALIIQTNTFTPDIALVVDGGTHDQLDIGQKGIIRCEIALKTAGGHSAFEQINQSASLQLLALINELNSFATSLPFHPSFNPCFINVSSIISETVPYGLPDQAQAHLEIQFPPPVTSEMWLLKLKEMKKHYSNLQISFPWVSEPHLMQNNNLIEIFTSAGLNCITTGGNNLAKDLCLAGVNAVSHCPVTEYLAHCKNERISLSDIEKGILLYNKIVCTFSQQ